MPRLPKRPPRLVTEVRWSLQAVEGGTLLRERVELSAPATSS